MEEPWLSEDGLEELTPEQESSLPLKGWREQTGTFKAMDTMPYGFDKHRVTDELASGGFFGDNVDCVRITMGCTGTRPDLQFTGAEYDKNTKLLRITCQDDLTAFVELDFKPALFTDIDRFCGEESKKSFRIASSRTGNLTKQITSAVYHRVYQTLKIDSLEDPPFHLQVDFT